MQSMRIKSIRIRNANENLEWEVYKRIKSTKYAISDVPYHELFSCKLYE